MSCWKNKSQQIVLYLLAFFPFTLVNAASIPDNLIEFSLSITHQNTPFNFSSYTYKTSSDQIGINWYEPFSKYFHGGLEVGQIQMSQVENVLASAKFTAGEYAGLLLRFIPIDNDYLSLTLINSSKHQAYRFGVNFKTGNSGIVSIMWHTGFRDGTQVYFTRKLKKKSLHPITIH